MKKHIQTYLQQQLNDQQYDAASYVDGHSLILAWAGSGKTRTLTYMVANLVYWHDVDQNSILAVTFTNKAAAEMKERLAKIIDEMWNLSPHNESDNTPWEEVAKTKEIVNKTWNTLDDSLPPPDFIPPEVMEIPPRAWWSQTAQQFPWIGTFHGIFLKILKIDIELLWDAWYKRKKNFVIYDAWDSMTLIKSIIKAKEMKDYVEAKEAKNTISAWKSKWYIPDQAWLHCDTQSEEWILEIYQEYWKQCQDANALDFDDLLLLPKVLFAYSADALYKRQNKFDHILVDEAQDTNTIQFELMQQLVGKNGKIVFIWDDYQSIYRWRGAVMSNFLNLENMRPSIKTFKLETNYRSLPHIVEAGNAIISHNKTQYKKDIKPHREWDKHIRIFGFADERDEAIQLLEMITKLKEEWDKQWSDFTILYRTNAQSAPFEQVCITDGLPYKILGGKKFFERREIKDILSYVKFLVNPDDSLALKRIINTPTRQIGNTTIQQCEDIAAQAETTLSHVVLHIDQYAQKLKPAALTKIKKFTIMIQEMLWALAMQTPAQLIENITKWVRYEDHLIKTDGKDNASERMWNIWQLVNMAMKFTDIWVEATTTFLEEVSLLTSVEDTKAEDADAIKMMTVHGSKGLEFPNVFVVWMEENIFPLPNAKFDDAELEEERRGMYVAITRAQNQLFLSYAHSRQQRWMIKNNPPSRFLDELPDNLVKKYDMAGASAYMHGMDEISRDAWDRVTHKLFGAGTIMEVRDRICIARFDNPKFGVRKLEGKWLKEE